MKWTIMFIAILTVTCAVWGFVEHRYRQQQFLGAPLPAVVSPETTDQIIIEEQWDFGGGANGASNWSCWSGPSQTPDGEPLSPAW
jgi:hypothetical protein